MNEFLEHALVRYPVSAVLIAVALALQFVPLYQKRIERLLPRYPALKILTYRVFQLVAGFGLLAVGIDMLRMH